MTYPSGKTEADILALAQEIVRDFEERFGTDPDRASELYEGFQDFFAGFVSDNQEELAGLIYGSELDQSDKLLYIHLIFHNILDYENFQVMLEKLEGRTLTLEEEAKQLEEQIAQMEAEQEALRMSIQEHGRKANEAFIDIQDGIVHEGLLQAEANKRGRESEEVDAIKQQLKQQ